MSTLGTMRKIVLTMLLAVVSSSAAAEWVEVADDEERSVYIDPATFRWDKSKNKVKLWILEDLKTVKSEIASMKSHYEFDCKEEQLRIIFGIAHSKNMGRGDVLFSGADPFNWGPVVPGSKGAILWKIACKKS